MSSASETPSLAQQLRDLQDMKAEEPDFKELIINIRDCIQKNCWELAAWGLGSMVIYWDKIPRLREYLVDSKEVIKNLERLSRFFRQKPYELQIWMHRELDETTYDGIVVRWAI
jgi:hypothetical protein